MLVDAGLCMWMQEKTKRIKLVYPSWFMQWVIWWDHAVRCYSAYGAVNPHWNNQNFSVGLRKMRGCESLNPTWRFAPPLPSSHFNVGS